MFEHTRTGVYHTFESGVTREVRVTTLHPMVAAAYRRMTPQERLGAAVRQTLDIRRALDAQLRARHPDWSSEQVAVEIARRISGGHRA